MKSGLSSTPQFVRLNYSCKVDRCGHFSILSFRFFISDFRHVQKMEGNSIIQVVRSFDKCSQIASKI